MRKVSILGFVVGGIVDVVSSVILGLPFGLYALSQLDMAHTPKDQLQHAINLAMHANIPLHAAELMVGIACSVLGGYVAAAIAKHHEMLNGLLSAYLCTGMGIFVIAAHEDSDPLVLQLLLLIASPAAALLGGYLRSRQTRVRLHPAGTSAG